MRSNSSAETAPIRPALLRLLAALPIERQHELGVPCLGDAVVGAEHSCRWEPAQGFHATPALP